MTVREFLRAYYSFGSQFQGILVVQNDGTGRLKNLYSSNDGYHDQWIRPEVRDATIKTWTVQLKPYKRIYIVVEPNQ